MGDSSVLAKQLFTVAFAVLLLWTLNSGLNNIGAQLKRQALATEYQAELIKKQTRILEDLDDALKMGLGLPLLSPPSPKK